MFELQNHSVIYSVDSEFLIYCLLACKIWKPSRTFALWNHMFDTKLKSVMNASLSKVTETYKPSTRGYLSCIYISEICPR